MNINIDVALNKLYQRQIVTREQLLNEMLRVKLTEKELQLNNKNTYDKDKLFRFMKKTTEDELGFFPADRDDFVDIYEVLKEIDIVDFTLEIFKDDRMGTIISPSYLTTYIKDKAQKVNPKKILITEAEKHLAGLKEFADEFSNVESTLTTESKQMYLLLKLIFSDYQNIRIIFESIYSDCLIDEKFDYIYSLPTFGYKPENALRKFITRDSDGIAMENMLEHLDEKGTLDIIVPAKITFTSMGYEKLRAFITNNYNVKSIFILPEGTFRPSTAIKTYLFTLTKCKQDEIEIGTLKPDNEIFYKEAPTPNVIGVSDSHQKQVFGSLLIEDKKQIKTKEFLSHEDWRVELLLSGDDENIQKFKNSNLEKVKLKNVAEVFRGKSILKKDTTVGSISVLNISNIENGEINYDCMGTIDEEERKIKRYELINNDVLISCRGTAIKSAVFKQQDKLIIASANVIVIRPKEKVLGEYIKIFFESPIGMAIIKSFQRGTTIMNINHSDIMEMEIPLLSINEQKEMIKNYNEELNIYKAVISKAESRWDNIKNKLYNKLI
ncbi:restriction endonuclease subunit S [uncultured Clostridium sp.]|uniref:restriction endonuclease subunit S n=1 Tax=uncultured Clostridium sp. TaxID=59620 RepID=UPI0028E4F7B4|nr:restriction endonuclease subunit S [uncultured Clostridium sp.]